MNPIYEELRRQALILAARYPQADFYLDHPEAAALSRGLFEADMVVGDLRDFVAAHLGDDFGHGMRHADLVALDAGALAAVESFSGGRYGGRVSEPEARHRVRMAQCAGLLHDIRRKRRHHAREGAAYAQNVLDRFGFAPGDTYDICLAIENHEAFSETRPLDTLTGALLSDCLYDADKFRWGIENFTHTVWAMVSYADMPIDRFVALYPGGMGFLERIKATFRTPTGRVYGPRFIDQGLSLGREIYGYMRQRGLTPSGLSTTSPRPSVDGGP